MKTFLVLGLLLGLAIDGCLLYLAYMGVGIGRVFSGRVYSTKELILDKEIALEVLEFLFIPSFGIGIWCGWYVGLFLITYCSVKLFRHNKMWKTQL